MTSTSPSEQPDNIITKDSDHPAHILLGQVVGAYLLGSAIILYYGDHRQVAVAIDMDGLLAVADHKVPSC